MKTVKLEQFDQAIQQIFNEKTKCIMIFTSDKDKNGKYWCPSCQKIVPYYQKIEKQAKNADLPIYRFLAGDYQTWKDEQHKFRTNLHLKIKSVPTMGYFDGEKLKNKLDSDQIVQKIQRDLLFQFCEQE